jgi:glutamate racemase
LQAHGIQTMVVACNTATAAAVEQLRRQYPSLPIVGVEPALKPAAQTSRTHRVGVMATRGTLQSNKFKTLLDTLQGQADFTVQACDGLADAIERQDSARIEALCRQYTQAMGRFGSAPDEIDTLVLGCTHYPFAANTLRTLVGDQVQLLESGAPVARQTRRVLPVPSDVTTHQPMLRICTTGHPQLLQAALSNWLQINPEIETLRI